MQLHLEDNGSKTYLKNTLDLAGNWSDDNGLVVANKASFLQHAFNRNLGLNNHTEWIQRTTNGGGFYLKTTNFVQTNPQVLAIEGDMQARQDVRLSNMGKLQQPHFDKKHPKTQLDPCAFRRTEY